ncbi:uncharacterized protein LOC144100051 [Amblyomma americanum]
MMRPSMQKKRALRLSYPVVTWVLQEEDRFPPPRLGALLGSQSDGPIAAEPFTSCLDRPRHVCGVTRPNTPKQPRRTCLLEPGCLPWKPMVAPVSGLLQTLSEHQTFDWLRHGCVTSASCWLPNRTASSRQLRCRRPWEKDCCSPLVNNASCALWCARRFERAPINEAALLGKEAAGWRWHGEIDRRLASNASGALW